MAVIKATNPKVSTLKQGIKYITNPEKAELITGKDCAAETALEEMQATKELYNKTDGRQYMHFVQSFKPDDPLNPSQAHQIGLEMAQKHFKGYEVLVATHTDRDHLHNHLIVNSVNFENGIKIPTIAIAYFLLYTGLRVSELVALNRQDIVLNERSGTVVVRKGKGDIERKVPLPVEARIHLKNYLDSREDFKDAVFLSNYQKRISIRSVQRILEKFYVHPHQLRHTYCRELVCAGIDISTVADLAGHADINVTRRYSKPSTIELEDAIERAFS